MRLGIVLNVLLRHHVGNASLIVRDARADARLTETERVFARNVHVKWLMRMKCRKCRGCRLAKHSMMALQKELDTDVVRVRGVGMVLRRLLVLVGSPL